MAIPIAISAKYQEVMIMTDMHSVRPIRDKLQW